MGCVSSRQETEEDDEYSHRSGKWDPGRENRQMGNLKLDILERDRNDISQNVTEGKLCFG